MGKLLKWFKPLRFLHFENFSN